MLDHPNMREKLLKAVLTTIIVGLLLPLPAAAWAGQCTERKWREDYPKNKQGGLICENSTSEKIFYIFSDSKDCAFELYYRNGRILAQSYVVTRYIDYLDFSGLRLDRKMLSIEKGRETYATCRVANAQIIIDEYNRDVESQLENNKF